NLSTAEVLVTVNNSVPTATYSVPPEGGITFVTNDAGDGQLTISHARFAVGEGPNAALAGVAIVDFRQNGVLVSEAGVPATLPLTSGRIYTEIQGAVTTGMAFSNPSPTDAIISYYFTDAFGAEFASGSFALAADTQVSKLLNQPPFNAPTPLQGTFTF